MLLEMLMVFFLVLTILKSKIIALWSNKKFCIWGEISHKCTFWKVALSTKKKSNLDLFFLQGSLGT